MRSQNMDISAISLNVRLEWVSGYRQNDSLFSQSYMSILLLAWKDQTTISDTMSSSVVFIHNVLSVR
jgi:hypothetical protein